MGGSRESNPHLPGIIAIGQPLNLWEGTPAATHWGHRGPAPCAPMPRSLGQSYSGHRKMTAALKFSSDLILDSSYSPGGSGVIFWAVIPWWVVGWWVVGGDGVVGGAVGGGWLGCGGVVGWWVVLGVCGGRVVASFMHYLLRILACVHMLRAACKFRLFG